MSHLESEEKVNPRRAIYLLPNLCTTGALFFGFYAIVRASLGEYESAAIAIFVAVILDGLDGRIARLTNTQSAFGAQYDSLSDVVSFGIAPALVMHSWVLSTLGKMGWVAAFFYAAAATLRLARFNTQLAVPEKTYFIGLACTPAAACVASFVWVAQEYAWSGPWLPLVGAGLCIVLGLLMVSNVHYYSFKELDLKYKVPFVAVLLGLLVFIGVSLDPPVVLLLLCGSYVLSGLGTEWKWQRRKKALMG
jgi:CDP-diacylglycerol---serine O-phosphatidyltransferase